MVARAPCPVTDMIVGGGFEIEIAGSGGIHNGDGQRVFGVAVDSGGAKRGFHLPIVRQLIVMPVTCGLPWVMVPVLSTASARSFPTASR